MPLFRPLLSASLPLSLIAALALGLGGSARAATPTAEAAEAINPADEQALGAALWARAPQLAAIRGALVEAEAFAQRSQLLPNPLLSAGWNTIPIGEHNPPGLPFWDIPNYTVGVSELFEIGKRGPRQRAAEWGRKAAAYTLEDGYAQAFFTLMQALTDQAAAVARVAVFERLVHDSAETIRLQRARADKGDVAAIEVDRLEVEDLRLQSSQREAQGAREAALAACSELLGRVCPRFGDEAQALAFLTTRQALPAVTADAALDRPDVRAAGAERARADAERVLADRLRIPDPVAGVTYTNDRFRVAGNQTQSLSLALAVPLPIFDRGQPERRRARTEGELASARREALMQSANANIAIQQRQLRILTDRARLLEEEALPRARQVVERISEAARRGGAALPDVLLARRAFEELELDRVDVTAAARRATLELRRQAGLYPKPPAQ